MATYMEQGYTGLRQLMGFIEEAYHADLRWPSVQPLYSRIRRSDPEVSMVRGVFSAMVRGVTLEVTLPDKPSDADRRAAEFVESVLDDLDGGQSLLLETMIDNVPFFGWGVWEIVPGLRSPKWAPPGDDDWRSQYSDNRVGIRRLGWRDSSSFDSWDISPTGKVRGMYQYAYPNPRVYLPTENCLHLTFGDSHNPEGLTPLEAVWRLERIKYGLEIIQGIGFEHSAGHLSVQANKTLTDADRVDISRSARAIMTAQEGNYAVWPEGFIGELKDVNFSAAMSLLEAIKYFGILKLQLFNSQWMALSATTGAGSYSAMNDSSSMFMITFNAMMAGFASQINRQLIRKLEQWNPTMFAGVTERPRIEATRLEKKISLTELAQILGPLKNTMPLGDDDFIAIRRMSEFLPETLAKDATPAPEPAPAPDDNTGGEDVPEDAGKNDAEPVDEAPSEAEAQLRARAARYILRHPEVLREFRI